MNIHVPTAVPRVTDDRLAVPHGFFTREGGASSGLYASLNAGIGSGDAAEAVAENRRRICATLGVERLATPFQVHSPDAVITAKEWEERPRADAVATATPGLAVGVVTADCGPILLADAQAGVVAAAHAGWKGALAGVTDAVVARMEALGADRTNIRATLGPTIGPASYEVDDAFRDRFVADDVQNAAFFRAAERPGHAMFDLPAYILRRLARAGVDARWTGDDTYADEGRFFSYRRATHRGEPDYGRMLAAVALP